MALKGVKPETVPKRLKGLFFGPAGSGKTWTAIGFPSPYLIDTEKGATNEQYVKRLKASGGLYYSTADFDEMLAEVKSLLTEKHNYRTLIIDPLTVVYNDLCDKAARHLAIKSKDADSDGTEFGRHKQHADRQVKHLLNLLLRLDMNVIITSHSKTKWEKSGDSFKEAGATFDCYSKLDYLFDLVFEVQQRSKDSRVGIVRKTRVEGFPLGEVFPFSYEEIATRYGRDVLEKTAETVKLIGKDRLARVMQLIEALHVEPATSEKWLDKAGCDTLAELSEEQGEKVIAMLESKIAVAPAPATAAQPAA